MGAGLKKKRIATSGSGNVAHFAAEKCELLGGIVNRGALKPGFAGV